jgi:hypothetical protein
MISGLWLPTFSLVDIGTALLLFVWAEILAFLSLGAGQEVARFWTIGRFFLTTSGRNWLSQVTDRHLYLVRPWQ